MDNADIVGPARSTSDDTGTPGPSDWAHKVKIRPGRLPLRSAITSLAVYAGTLVCLVAGRDSPRLDNLATFVVWVFIFVVFVGVTVNGPIFESGRRWWRIGSGLIGLALVAELAMQGRFFVAPVLAIAMVVFDAYSRAVRNRGPAPRGRA